MSKTFHNSPTPEVPAAASRMSPPEPSVRGRRSGIAVMVVAALFGFLGGSIVPAAKKFFDQGLSLSPSTPSSPAVTAPVQSPTFAEDKAISDLIAKNASGVVSIVITKDVPKVRDSLRSPFGGLPFFFSPFGPQDIEGRGDPGAVESEPQQIGSGSGFFVSEDGLIVTNKHVVSDTAASYTVLRNDGQEYPATILARDPINDIAIMKIEGTGFPVLTLGDSDGVRVGQTAIAIGNPLGEFANSATRGIISGMKRNVSAGSGLGTEERLLDILQTDAAINPGNSGGPLFNLEGTVIGVNVAMAQGAENIGFALPINPVKRVVEQVRRTGRITVPYIGVRYVLVNKTLQKANNLPYDYGALILRGQQPQDLAVIPGSPADKAGLVEDDIILAIDGTNIDTDHPLGNVISAYEVGKEITLTVWRKGEERTVKLVLEERPS